MATFRARGGRPVTMFPSITISPEVGRSSPAIMRINVVLPQPDGPSRTRNSPSLAMRSMPSTARTSSKSLVMRRVSTMAMRESRLPPSAKPFTGTASVPGMARWARNSRAPTAVPARRSDHLSIFPFRPDRFHLGVSPRESILRSFRTCGGFGEHRVDHPGRESLIDRGIGVAGIADVGRPIEHVRKDRVLIRRYRLGILRDELGQIGNGLREAGEIVEFAGHEALFEVVDVIDQEGLRAAGVFGKLPDQ